MTSAPQGPGWWQASDGNWYPPQQSAGYQAPPPSAAYPAAYPQYSAPPGQPFSIANLPTAAWLLIAGLVLDLITNVLPSYTVSDGTGTHEIRADGGTWVSDLIGTVVFGLLIWATFARPPQVRLGPLIALTILAGIAAIGIIGSWTFLVPSSGSPAVGVFASTAVFGLWVAGIVMAWMARSAAPRPY